MGHISLKRLQNLVKKGIIDLKEVKDLNFYDACALGKIHKNSFSRSTQITSVPLEYVHLDLWGSFKIPVTLLGS